MTNIRMEKILDGQVAVISGGAGDIGFATAVALAQRGAHIALCDLQPPDAVADNIKAIERLGVKCTYDEMDTANAAEVEKWVKKVAATLGTPQLIIPNAAITQLRGFYEITAAEWQRHMDVNLNGAFYLAQAATTQLLQQGLPGRVVFVGSWAANHVHNHMPAYSVSKAGLSMLCKCLALELAPYTILVNEIAPGYVDSGLSGKIWKEDPESEKAARKKIPTGRVISAAEVAEQIVYLCDPANCHMTGSTLLMDGGLSLKY